MTGFSPSGKLSIYTDYVSSPLTAYVRVIANAYSGGEFKSTRFALIQTLINNNQAIPLIAVAMAAQVRII